MEDIRIGQRYAGALYEVALKSDAMSAVSDDLKLIVNSLTSDARFKEFLFSPETPRESKVQICEKTFGDKITANSMHFLRLLLDKRRESEIESIQIEFEALRRDYEKTTLVKISSAYPLSEREQGLLIEKIRKITGGEVEVVFETDPVLIGGVKISFDDKVLDDTLRGHLEKLRNHLAFDLTHQ